MSHTWTYATGVCDGLALVSRIDKITGLFAKEPYKRDDVLQKEAYDSIDPPDCSHPIHI